jgi:HEAT repeat protein
MSRESIDERLRRVSALRNEDDLAVVRAGLLKGLADPSNLVVAEAAAIVGELELSGFEAALLAAWKRLLVDPEVSTKTYLDKGCTGKNAIIETLGRLNFDDPEFLLAGLAYEQKEPGWPESEDTAVNMRGGCAFALARSRQMRAVDKLVQFVELMQRKLRLDRVHAAQAIADVGVEYAKPLLQLKLLSGDAEAEVLGACMSSLLRLDATWAIPVVARFLNDPNEQVLLEAAAALGETGRAEAVEALLAKLQRTRDRELRQSLLMSLGLSRETKAIDFLIAQVATNQPEAEYSLRSLKPASTYPEIRSRVGNAIAQSGNARLESLWQKLVLRPSSDIE